MTVMAILQDVDKCMRCNGCVVACRREWNLALPTDINQVLPSAGTPAQTVKPNVRLAIKSQRRSDMGAFVRYSCWHCPSPPCVPVCPKKAIVKQANGAVSVDTALCDPEFCQDSYGRYPCEYECQRGGYPKIGEKSPFEGGGNIKDMNKCTLCYGRAGISSDPKALPTRQIKNSAGEYVSPVYTLMADLGLGTAPDRVVPELEHEPACVASCPAKAMVWDSRANIRALLAASYKLNGVNNWVGDGSMFWGSKEHPLAPPKADPFIEDHVTPTIGSLGAKLVLPTLVVGGLAALSARRTRIASGEEV